MYDIRVQKKNSGNFAEKIRPQERKSTGTYHRRTEVHELRFLGRLIANYSLLIFFKFYYFLLQLY